MGVTSGRVETGTLRNSKFYAAWQQKEQIIPENFTDINWQAGLANGDSWYSNAVRINNVVIDNETVSYGGTWSNITTKGDIELLSGTKRIYHNSDGKKSFAVSISGWLYSYSDTSGSNVFELNQIPRQANIISAPDFNDEENPTITYSNPAGEVVNSLQACISWTGAADILYRDISKTGTSYTFNFTDAEREKLRKAVTSGNTLNVTFYVKTEINGTIYYSTLPKIMVIINANPNFDNWSYQDANEKTLALTGNNQIVIKNHSKITGTITSANKATAKKYAVIEKYLLLIGNNPQAEATYSDTEDVTTSPPITATEKVFMMFAQDNRKLTKSKTIFVPDENYKQYTDINIKEGKATRTGGVGTETTLELKGDIWNNSFGEVENDIISCIYRYKKSNEDNWFESDQTLTPVKSGNSYSLTTTIKGDLGAEGFTRDYSFDIEIVIADKLSTYTYKLTLGSGKPNIAVHRNGVAFGAPYDTEKGGLVQVDGENITEKNIFTAKLGSNFNCTTLSKYTKITGWQEEFKVGDKISLVNDEIVIGAGVSKILLSAKITWYAAIKGIRYVFINKNNVNWIWSTLSLDNDSFGSDIVNSFPINVNEGDKISIDYYTDTSGDSLGNNGRTYLSVEVIE